MAAIATDLDDGPSVTIAAEELATAVRIRFLKAEDTLHWFETGAAKPPSMVRVDKVYTLDQRLVRRIFGRVNTTTITRIASIPHQLVIEQAAE